MMIKLAVVAALATLAIASPVAPKGNPVEKGLGLFCKPGEFTCAMKGLTKPTCVPFNKFCNGHQDCPQGDDEHNDYCTQKAANVKLNEQVAHEKSANEKLNEQVAHEKAANEKLNEEVAHEKAANEKLNEQVVHLTAELSKPPKPCNNTCPSIPNLPGHGNDGENSTSGQGEGQSDNDFSGTGFMFAINQMVIDNSNVKMFNQNSDNIEKVEPAKP